MFHCGRARNCENDRYLPIRFADARPKKVFCALPVAPKVPSRNWPGCANAYVETIAIFLSLRSGRQKKNVR